MSSGLKLFSALAFLACVFFVESPVACVIIALLLFVIFRLLSLRFFGRGRYIVLSFLFFTFLSNLLWREGRIIFAMGPLTITQEGAVDAFVVTMKIAFMIAGARLLSATASVDTLVNACGRMLKPFEYLGLPVNDFMSAVSLTLRVLPAVRDECLALCSEKMRDQEVRGFSHRVKVATSLLVPLLVRSLENPERHLSRTRVDG